MRAPLLSDAGNGAGARKGLNSIARIVLSVSLSAFLVAVLLGSSSQSTSNQADELIALKASPLQQPRPGFPALPRQASRFVSSALPRAGRHSVVARADGDPTGSPLIKVVNALQQSLQNSPLAEGKKLFAKLQAGDYDVEETRAKLEQQISTSPCIMYSFST
jgi:hypothetical protein